MKNYNSLTSQAARWGYALVWTAIVTILLLKPAEKQTIEMSLENFLVAFFSLSLGVWDFIEAIYHVIIFASLTALWYWALVTYFSSKRTLLIVVSVVGLFGLATEIGQYFVHRSSLMFDALANFLGITLCVVWLKHSNPS